MLDVDTCWPVPFLPLTLKETRMFQSKLIAFLFIPLLTCPLFNYWRSAHTHIPNPMTVKKESFKVTFAKAERITCQVEDHQSVHN